VLPEGEKAQVFLRDGRVVIRVPMKLRHVSGRTEIIAPQALRRTRGSVPGKPSALAVALARALRWAELLDQGRYPTVAALAAAVGLERSYVARVLNLALLAPDLADAILHGQEPSGLSLARLRDDFPVEWVRQRLIFGVL
jgi:hypothetical protein